jgi:hypothetical protein
MATIDRRIEELTRKAEAATAVNRPTLPLILRDDGDGVPRDRDGNAVDLSHYPADGPRVMITRRMSDADMQDAQRRAKERRSSGVEEGSADVGLR